MDSFSATKVRIGLKPDLELDLTPELELPGLKLLDFAVLFILVLLPLWHFASWEFFE